MERFDIHVALAACDIVIESATIVAILESDSKTEKRIISQSGLRVTGQALKTKFLPLEERQRMSCRGLACRPAAHFALVRFYGFWAVVFRLSGVSIVSTAESDLSFLKGAVARRR
jgi:hypothetical protein